MNYLGIAGQHYNSEAMKYQMGKRHIDLSGNILILSDRLTILASTLSNCIESVTDAKVIGNIQSYYQVVEYISYDIDYLIIAGYLKNEESYNVLNILRSNRSKRRLKTVKWAILDELIFEYCIRYRIFFQFDRRSPVTEFLEYLIEIKDKNDYLFH